MPLSGPEPPEATLSFPNLRRELARRFATEMKAVTGRGPDHVRVFVNQNLITLFAQGTLTPAEESLIEAKRGQAAQDIQTELQMVIRDRFSEAIEETDRSQGGLTLERPWHRPRSLRLLLRARPRSGRADLSSPSQEEFSFEGRYSASVVGANSRLDLRMTGHGPKPLRGHQRLRCRPQHPCASGGVPRRGCDLSRVVLALLAVSPPRWTGAQGRPAFLSGGV